MTHKRTHTHACTNVRAHVHLGVQLYGQGLGFKTRTWGYSSMGRLSTGVPVSRISRAAPRASRATARVRSARGFCVCGCGWVGGLGGAVITRKTGTPNAPPGWAPSAGRTPNFPEPLVAPPIRPRHACSPSHASMSGGGAGACCIRLACALSPPPPPKKTKSHPPTTIITTHPPTFKWWLSSQMMVL